MKAIDLRTPLRWVQQKRQAFYFWIEDVFDFLIPDSFTERATFLAQLAIMVASLVIQRITTCNPSLVFGIATVILLIVTQVIIRRTTIQ